MLIGDMLPYPVNQLILGHRFAAIQPGTVVIVLEGQGRLPPVVGQAAIPCLVIGQEVL